MRRATVAAWIVCLVMVACGSPGTQPTAITTPPTVPPVPAAIPSAPIIPSHFVHTIDNSWFPLSPGTTYVYKGQKDKKTAVETIVVDSQTKVVFGVACVVVTDSMSLNGHLVERVTRWYAQDVMGNVWYFGEADEQLDAAGRVVGNAGSWKAGLRGAYAGIVMAVIPQVGAKYYEEYWKGHVENQFEYTDLNATVTVQYGAFTNVVVIKESTRLEPGRITFRHFARGVGLVKVTTTDGSETLELAQVSPS